MSEYPDRILVKTTYRLKGQFKTDWNVTREDSLRHQTCFKSSSLFCVSVWEEASFSLSSSTLFWSTTNFPENSNKRQQIQKLSSLRFKIQLTWIETMTWYGHLKSWSSFEKVTITFECFFFDANYIMLFSKEDVSLFKIVEDLLTIWIHPLYHSL